jgi:hypothetical protein
MSLQKMMLIALLAAAVSATTMPTLGMVLGFGHTAAYAGDQNDNSGNGSDEDEDMNDQ